MQYDIKQREWNGSVCFNSCSRYEVVFNYCETLVYIFSSYRFKNTLYIYFFLTDLRIPLVIKGLLEVIFLLRFSQTCVF